MYEQTVATRNATPWEVRGISGRSVPPKLAQTSSTPDTGQGKCVFAICLGAQPIKGGRELLRRRK